MTSKVVSLPDFIEIISEPVELQSWMRQYIIDALTDLHKRRSGETRAEHPKDCPCLACHWKRKHPQCAPRLVCTESHAVEPFALAYVEEMKRALLRATFAKNRLDPCTWILYLLQDDEISVGKAAEWLREFIHDGKEGSLPDVASVKTPECSYCHGNDRDMPCAYPSEGKPGCVRDKRLADETPARREYHARGTYWSGAPTMDMPCDICTRPFVDHDPRTHACPLETVPMAILTAALARIAELMKPDPASDSPEGRELSLLVDLAELYERRKYPEFSGEKK